MIKELEQVVLTRALPGENLEAGDVGTVVLVHGNGEAFEVEFTTLNGDTLAVVTIPCDSVRPVQPRDLMHAREVA